jgi:hypothetical protein
VQHLRAERRELGGFVEPDVLDEPRVGTTRGSAVSMPSTSVQISIASASIAAPKSEAE